LGLCRFFAPFLFLLKVITKGGGKRPNETLATSRPYGKGATFYHALRG
jgi:hypothetical protein